MRATLYFIIAALMASPAFAVSEVQEVEGRGGQKAWLIEDHTLPIVTVRVEFEQAGAAYDRKGKEGLANFAIQMLDEGAGNMDSLAFNRMLGDHAIRFDAETDEDSATVSLQALSEFKDKAFSLLALVLDKPRFDKEAVERVRSALLSEIREMQENPDYVASLAWKQVVFVGHPYQPPRIGTADSVSAIQRADLQSYAGSVLACSHRIISIVGDITPAEAKKLIVALSVHAPACKTAPLQYAIADVAMPQGGEPVIAPIMVPQTVISASLPGVPRNDKRYYAMVVLNQIFGGGVFTSRLGEEIRNKRGLAYDTVSYIAEMAHASYIGVHFATRSEQAKTALGVFMVEYDKMRDKGVTQAELDAAKRYLTGSFPLGLDNQGALAEYVTQMQRYHLGRDYLEKRNSLINAVTLKDVNELAKTLFASRPVVVMAGAPNKEGK